MTDDERRKRAINRIIKLLSRIDYESYGDTFGEIGFTDLERSIVDVLLSEKLAKLEYNEYDEAFLRKR